MQIVFQWPDEGGIDFHPLDWAAENAEDLDQVFPVPHHAVLFEDEDPEDLDDERERKRRTWLPTPPSSSPCSGSSQAPTPPCP